MAEIRLSKLPDRTPVKVTLNLDPQLKRELDSYAALYAESYGNREAVVDLIPAMLASFLEGDRHFQRWRREHHGA